MKCQRFADKLECWSNGVSGYSGTHHSNTPVLHHSILVTVLRQRENTLVLLDHLIEALGHAGIVDGYFYSLR